MLDLLKPNARVAVPMAGAASSLHLHPRNGLTAAVPMAGQDCPMPAAAYHAAILA
ncbi:hypothetical protein [Martelella sp. HB161492]|uniref:hypothetical protein n=1 Tax=Martelella sp. HB161492 TaxID=2720726 RepID=UPI001591A4B3|nr:hypothetical protein [Martelella sp. HB161492]